MTRHQWNKADQLSPHTFTCGYCGKLVASERGYFSGISNTVFRQFSYICPSCCKPTFFDDKGQATPDVVPGVDVLHVPELVDQLYREARKCIAVGCYTSSVLTCRKLLMNIAVTQGAASGESFQSYVEYLAMKGFVPPHGKGWVDHIRKKGNEANHEIVLMKKQDAEDLVTFLEMLLKFIFEFPNKIPTQAVP